MLLGNPKQLFSKAPKYCRRKLPPKPDKKGEPDREDPTETEPKGFGWSYQQTFVDTLAVKDTEHTKTKTKHPQTRNLRAPPQNHFEQIL